MTAPVTAPPRPRHLFTALALAAVLTGCASTATPVVYPSPKASPARSASMESDLAACRRSAEANVGISGARAPRVASGTAKRGTVEFVDRAVESLVIGSRNAWEKARGAAAGVMAGTLTSVVLNWNEPDGVYREYVDQCLKERGHRVLGWR